MRPWPYLLLASLIAAALAAAPGADRAAAQAAETPVIGCGPAGPRGITARVRPGDCVMYSLGTGDAGYWSIRNIRWRSWAGGSPPRAEHRSAATSRRER